jgi:hypothetical protein
MQTVLTEYNNAIGVLRAGVNNELEIRLRAPTIDAFKELSKGAERKNTIDEVSMFSNGQYVKTHIAGSSTIVRKERKATGDFEIDGNKFRLAYTTEESVDAMPPATLFRMKSRFSKRIGDWRVDCTRIATASSAANLRALRDIVFGEGEDPRVKIEIEAELVSPRRTDEAEIHRVCSDLLQSLDSSNALRSAHAKGVMEIAKILGASPRNYSLKTILNAAKSIDKEEYYSTIFPPAGMYATRKAEGLRAVVRGGDATYLLTASGYYLFGKGPDVVLDCEFVAKEAQEPAGYIRGVDGLTSGICYIFDVMWYEKDVSALPFAERIKLLGAIAPIMPRGLTWVAKPYVRLEIDKLAEQLSALAKPADFPQDGIILTTPSANYAETVNYKWKPPADMTIDFLAKKCPSPGIAPYTVRKGLTLYLLFLGIAHREREARGIMLCDKYRDIFPSTRAEYYPVQFAPPYNPLAYLAWLEDGLDGRIVELRRGDSDEWELVRARDDKSAEEYNSYSTGLSTYKNYINPFLLEDLWRGPSGYFESKSTDIYKAKNRFHRFVISQLFKQHIGEVVVDMAAGRGADLPRYINTGVKWLFAADIDAAAIVELISRHSNIIRGKRGGGVLQPSERVNFPRGPQFTLLAHQMDFLQDYRENIAATEKLGMSAGSADAVVCNFAFHYFCTSVESIANALTYAWTMLKPDGKFIITCMDGKKINALFLGKHRSFEAAKRGGRDINQWQVLEDGQVKYCIRREYEGSFGLAGQMISVKMPFAEEMKAEPLANIDEIMRAARTIGFTASTGGFADFLTPELPLSDGDTQYTSLHAWIVLKKKKNAN